MHHADKMRKHVKGALTWMIVSVFAWLANWAYWDAVEFYHAYPGRFNLWTHFAVLESITSLVAMLASALVGYHLIRAQVCAAIHHKIASYSIVCYSIAGAAGAGLFIIAYIQIQLNLAEIRQGNISPLPFPADTIYADWGYDWLLLAPLYLLLASFLVLILPPALHLSNWTPTRTRTARVFAVVFLITSIGPSVLEFLQDRWHPAFMTNLINTPYAPANLLGYLDQLALIALTVFLFRLRKNAASLTRDHSHCHSCDYPLEPSVTTCPECGSDRTQESTHTPIQ